MSRNTNSPLDSISLSWETVNVLNSNGTRGLVVTAKFRDDLQLVFIIIAKLYTFLKYLLAIEGTKPVLQMPEGSAMVAEVARTEWKHLLAHSKALLHLATTALLLGRCSA